MAERDTFVTIADGVNYDSLYLKYLSGISANELGKEIGVQSGTIIYHFKKRGFKLRTHKEAINNRPVEMNAKISKTLKGKFFSGELVPWAKGLTKETDRRVNAIAKFKTGDKFYNWKGGRTKHPSGAIKLSRNGKQFWEHHKVWCESNNFPHIPKGCDIHHINRNPSDNRPENLVLLPKDIHQKLHYKLELNNNPNRIYWGKNYNKGVIING